MDEVKSWEMFMPKLAKATVDSTGEILEFEVTTPEQMVEVWAMASDYIKAYEHIKDIIKKKVPEIVNSNNTYEHGNYMFRISNIQRYTFDKSLMREVMDEDEVDLFLKPDPAKLKKYVAEDIKNGGDRDWGKLTNPKNLIPDGNPYEVIKLESLVSKKRKY